MYNNRKLFLLQNTIYTHVYIYIYLRKKQIKFNNNVKYFQDILSYVLVLILHSENTEFRVRYRRV